MMLLIDAGNTRLKWGLYDGAAWRDRGVLDYAGLAQLPALWGDQSPRAAWLCNVAGPAVGEALETLLAARGVALRRFASGERCAGVVNRYHNPAQLGADRWAALIGARAACAASQLVVCAGTATTIDVLTAEGEFLGGLIVPGIELMRTSLARGTAGLPLAEGDYTELPRSTDQAIVSGCIAAQLGAIRHMWRYVAHDAGAVVVMSGGASDRLLRHLELPSRSAPHLVLEGLARAACGDDAPGGIGECGVIG